MLDRLFRRLARGRIDGFERTFGYDATYMREVLEVSPGAFRAFAGIMKLSRHREGVPADVVYAAKVTTAAAEDCGPCAQLAVTMAEREGVPRRRCGTSSPARWTGCRQARRSGCASPARRWPAAPSSTTCGRRSCGPGAGRG